MVTDREPNAYLGLSKKETGLGSILHKLPVIVRLNCMQPWARGLQFWALSTLHHLFLLSSVAHES